MGSLLDGLAIAPPLRQRLRRVLEAPTPETWDAAYGIVLRVEPELTLTLWGAVRAVDETFPATKAARRGGWERVPDQLTLARALRYARASS